MSSLNVLNDSPIGSGGIAHNSLPPPSEFVYKTGKPHIIPSIT